MIQARLGLTGA